GNPEPRCPCLLLLDTSRSMQGSPICALNQGLVQFKEELMADSLSAKRIEIAIVTFGPVEIVTDFQSVTAFQPPRVLISGETPMGHAIETGITLVNERKEEYQRNGISYYRPWIFLITDGEPTDKWRKAASLVQEGERSRGFMFFPVGVDGANMDILGQIA